MPKLPETIVDILLDSEEEEFIRGFSSAEDRVGGRPIQGAPPGKELHRSVKLDTGHTLYMWINRWRGERILIGYRMVAPDGSILFQGDEYSPAPSYSPFGDQSMAELLSYLTIKPGDTDDEYFQDYTPEQLAWAESPQAEMLSAEVNNLEDTRPPWTDLDVPQ